MEGSRREFRSGLVPHVSRLCGHGKDLSGDVVEASKPHKYHIGDIGSRLHKHFNCDKLQISGTWLWV